MWLRHEKSFIEINEEQARIIADRIDRNKKVPIGLERLDPLKCEILKELPADCFEKGYKVVYQKQQLPSGDRSNINLSPIRHTPEQREKISNLISEARLKLRAKGFNV